MQYRLAYTAFHMCVLMQLECKVADGPCMYNNETRVTFSNSCQLAADVVQVATIVYSGYWIWNPVSIIQFAN